ncbi:hypothetical protein DFJ77DRAFT_366528 [Powellomyces hirtus]|nr:hypothetical protein DFJ77DRAFT_366528 [Powellomyces hirtus]
MSAQQRSFGAESLVAPTTGALNQGISGVAFGANHHQGAKNKNSKSTAESEALQLETQRMEEQLKLLRETMARGKEQKASSGRDTMWRAGGPAAKGSLSSYATDVLAKKNAALQVGLRFRAAKSVSAAPFLNNNSGNDKAHEVHWVSSRS